MSYSSNSSSQTSLIEPMIQIINPLDYEDYGFFSVSAHTDIGNRKSQEDRFLIVPNLGNDRHNISFFGVFDGTVGHFSSETIQKIIIRHLTESPAWQNLLNALETGKNIPNLASEAVFNMYKSADEELLSLCSEHLQDYASTTSVTVLIINNYIIIAHLGDSRVAVSYESRGNLASKFLTIDHKPNNPEEKMRIIASGGSVEFLCSHSNNPFLRGGDFTIRKARGDQPMQLQYSRAFGGKDLKKYGLSSNPDITIFERNDTHKCLLLASDGLWDIMSSDEAFKILFQAYFQHENPTKVLIEKALAKQRSRSKNADNITAVAVFLNQNNITYDQ
ncbi:serine/threonine protein phosphatase 2C, putative [Theileria annulata]|uniref:Serine/threonine protein phosphatase 2C, putative n=1 Tax=Theileria annulata TaxID=5874 RepID=Q4U9Q3_THEAN|nr:serine/threonine protein phosphatase 2C, putative [Theileria annulata]CAI76450.1 serine/threonine protein phosphatase 2C, putative [Theileria annulata]|eukprot:XP_953075.1 serine/threonine protein phosphatase 2C, putative [Theileria annulata]